MVLLSIKEKKNVEKKRRPKKLLAYKHFRYIVFPLKFSQVIISSITKVLSALPYFTPSIYQHILEVHNAQRGNVACQWISMKRNVKILLFIGDLTLLNSLISANRRQALTMTLNSLRYLLFYPDQNIIEHFSLVLRLIYEINVFSLFAFHYPLYSYVYG